MDTRKITIKGVVAEMANTFAEGHVCTAAEAKALNQLRAENVRNNMRKQVETAVAEEKDPAEIVSMIESYAADYIFTMASGGGGRTPTDPIEKEAISIARKLITDKCRADGRTVKAYREEVGDEAYNAKVAEVAEMEKVRELAAKRVADREKEPEFSI